MGEPKGVSVKEAILKVRHPVLLFVYLTWVKFCVFVCQFVRDVCTDEEVRSEIVSFSERISIARGLQFAIEMVLDDVLGIGELLVDGFVSDLSTDGVVFTISDVVNVFAVNRRVIPEDMVDDFSVVH